MACLFKRNGVYYDAILQDGKRLYKSTHARSKPEAVCYLVDLKKHLTTRKNVTLSAFFQDFLTFSLLIPSENCPVFRGKLPTRS